jgi:regulation of enolase protein 1 (concanavalin A-like superfamily)
MSDVVQWEGFSWLHEPSQWSVDATGELQWSGTGESDFWRYTGGVVGADDGDAFLFGIEGDFSVTMHLTTSFHSQYDQCGVMVRRDDRHWLKAGIESDDGLWFSVVETGGTSDWSRQAATRPDVAFTVWRVGDALRVGLVDDGRTQEVRTLTFDGPVSVGPYACAPKGPGFPASGRLERISEDSWVMHQRAG